MYQSYIYLSYLYEVESFISIPNSKCYQRNSMFYGFMDDNENDNLCTISLFPVSKKF